MSEPLNQDFWVDQLETIHKQMNEDDSERPDSEGTNISGSSGSGTAQHQQKRHSMFSGFLNKRDKSSDLPVFAGSSSHHGVLAANSGQDMNFVMGLSENLLLECRRLQAEIERKSRSLNSVTETYTQLQESYDTLSSNHSLAVKELELLKNSNLDLQSKFEELSANAQNSKDELAEKEQIIEDLSKAVNVAESDATTKNMALLKDTEKLKDQHAKDIEELREAVNTLRSSNGKLNAKLQDMDESKSSQALPVEENDKYITLQNRMHDARKLIANLKRENRDLTAQKHSGVAVASNEETIFKDRSEDAELGSSDKQIDNIAANIELYGDKNILALPNDNISEKSNKSSFSCKVMKERLECAGYRVLTYPEYNEMQSKLLEWEKPSESYLAQEINSRGKVIVLKEEYQRLLDMVSESNIKLKNMKNMKNTIDESSVETNKQKLKEAGYSVLDSKDYERLIKEAASPSLEKVAEIAKAQDYVLVHAKDLSARGIVDSETIGSLCDSGSFVLMNKDTHDALINGGFDKINKSEVIKMCSKVDLIPVAQAQYEELTKEPDMERIKYFAAQKASVVISRESYEILKSEADCPTEEVVRIFAKQNGLALVIKSDYDSLLEKLDNPSKHQLERQAEKLGLTLVSADKYNSLLHELNSRSIPTTPSNASKVLASKQYFEEVIRHENEKSEKFLESTKTLGFVTLSNEEYKTLRENQKDRVVTKTDIYHGAKNYDLAVLPNEEYKALLKKKAGGTDNLDYSDLEKIAARFDMKLIPFDMKNTELSIPHCTKVVDSEPGASLKFNEQDAATAPKLESRIENESSPTTEANDQMDQISSELRSDVISSNIINGTGTADAEPRIGTASSETRSTTFEDLQKKAMDMGYTLAALPNQDSSKIPDDDASEAAGHGFFGKLEDRGDFVDPNEKKLEYLASQLDMVVISKTAYLELSDHTVTKEFLESKASEFGLTVLSKSIYEEMSSRDVISKDNIEAKASKFGLRVFSEEELVSMEAKHEANSLKMETIEKNAQRLGYIILKQERMQELEATERAASLEKRKKDYVPEIASPVHDKTSGTPGTSEDLHPVSGTDSSNFDYNEVQVPDEHSISPLTKQQITEQANEYGLVVLDEAQYAAMKANLPMTKNQIIEQARNLKLIVIDENQYQIMKSAPKITKEKITRYAKEHGLVLLGKGQSEHIGATPTATKEQVISYARQYDLVAISCEDYKRLKNALVLSKEQLIKQIQTHDMVAINSKDYETMNRGISRAPSQSKPSSQRGSLDPDSTRSSTSSRPSSRYNDDFNKFFKSAIKNGIWKTPKGKSFAAPTKSHDVVLLPKSYYDNLISRGESEGHEGDFGKKSHLQSPSSRGQQRSMTRSSKSSSRIIEHEHQKNVVQASTVNAHADIERAEEQKVSSGGTSMRRALKKAHHPQGKIVSEPSLIRSNSLSGMSLASVASLTEPSIIPALTQTVIGEYLYKYYRFFGVESRHERFFWIHPYTLTLYWSSTNPVLETKSSAQRTKSAPILGVESVSDSNPYPAGLYHKSLLIKSDHKTVKITCPTRKRHNIWYNSLRYLIQRSMEGIKLEDIADDPDDNLYSGKVFPLPSEISNLNSNTFSSFQRLSSSKKSNRNLVPRSPSMPVKKV